MTTDSRTESEIALRELLDECRDYCRGRPTKDALAVLRNEIEQFVDLRSGANARSPSSCAYLSSRAAST